MQTCMGPPKASRTPLPVDAPAFLNAFERDKVIHCDLLKQLTAMGANLAHHAPRRDACGVTGNSCKIFRPGLKARVPGGSLETSFLRSYVFSATLPKGCSAFSPRCTAVEALRHKGQGIRLLP